MPAAISFLWIDKLRDIFNHNPNASKLEGKSAIIESIKGINLDELSSYIYKIDR